ncbi:MAG TPA: hypothetical protein VJ731_14285 [Terriglobales bacterium]|nr:hypothetical protein [Terriglobales bacterium]
MRAEPTRPIVANRALQMRAPHRAAVHLIHFGRARLLACLAGTIAGGVREGPISVGAVAIQQLSTLEMFMAVS